MIKNAEIKEKAKEFEVPLSTVERDYVQNWMLKYLAGLNLIFKGGTCIRKIYFEEYRFSDDLDFTLLKETDPETLKDEILNILESTHEESGIYFENKINLAENTNGYEISTYFQLAQRGSNLTKIKLDITKHENEPVLLPTEKRPIIHLYSDELESEIKAYSLEEIVAEKIRSLFQRTRPRDLYDTWFLWDKINIEKVIGILPEKFKLKEVEYNLEEFQKRRENYENSWKNSLNHQINPFPDFEEAYEAVYNSLDKLNKQWEKG